MKRKTHDDDDNDDNSSLLPNSLIKYPFIIEHIIQALV